MEVLNLCYGYRINEVVLSGEAIDTLSKLSSSQGYFSAIILDNTTKISTNVPVRRGYLHKVRVFVIAVSSSSSLKRYLQSAKASIWWNHMASFFIIEYPSGDTKPNCSKAHEILWTAWKMNLIDAKFICNNGTEEPLIYSYNPYMPNAPDPWQFEQSYRGINNHPWSLYVRNYRNDSLICEELDFEKSHDLGGYTIYANEKDWYNDWPPNSSRVHTNCSKGFDCFIVRSLSYSLNATFKIILEDGTANLGFINENGTVDGMLRRIIRGDFDMGLNNRYQATVAGLPVTYPHWQTGLSVLTKYSEYRSQLHKLMSVIDYQSRIGVFIVCFIINPLFFIFIMRQATIPAFLNSFRVIAYTPFPKLRRNLASRIYLVCLFFFMVTVEAIHQGKLASLLTRHIRHPHVNSMYDLKNSNHKIYGMKDFGRFFPNSVFPGRFVGLKNESCYHYVLHEPSAACLDDVNRAAYGALKFRLHRSRRTVMKFYWIWVIREDWPLERRINTIIQRLLESGVVDRSYMKKMKRVNQAFRIMDDISNDESAKVLTLSQLTFAFVILGTGLAIAGTTFIIEIIKNICSKKIRHKRIVVGKSRNRVALPFLTTLSPIVTITFKGIKENLIK